jgi:hypothetical protein
MALLASRVCPRKCQVVIERSVRGVGLGIPLQHCQSAAVRGRQIEDGLGCGGLHTYFSSMEDRVMCIGRDMI